MTQPAEPSSETTTAGAVRLVFSYDGDDVRLVLQQPVDVAVTGFDTGTVPRPGHYVEVRSAEGRALARVRLHGGIPTSAEVFGEPGEAITRVDLEHPHGAFTVVVPAPEEAARAVLMRIEPPAPGGHPTQGALAPPPQTVDLLDVALER
jgi:hypothetical protein